MKKRIFAILALVLLTLTLMAGCGQKVECDLCGELAYCETEKFLGQEVHICKECQDGLSKLGELFQ